VAHSATQLNPTTVRLYCDNWSGDSNGEGWIVDPALYLPGSLSPPFSGTVTH
jgi:hypothetical protein